ncbi:50S ribosomal protein L18e [Candidatus Micrarchaeota archaeon]|nr:50S ribosomal protein L18e [Candidatus Micrarchaeota archaeon]
MKKSKFRGPENAELKALVAMLEKTARKSHSGVWATVAEFLQKPARVKKNKAVNLYKLEKIAKDGDTIVVPSVLLGVGELKKKITVAAFKASKSAREKLGKNLISVREMAEKNPEGKKVRIILG